MAVKEAKARLRINRLLKEAGWRLFDDADRRPNVTFEEHVKITRAKSDAMGDDFGAVSIGFVDYVLWDDQDHPVAVLEAKAEDKDPLIGKEQARRYAKAETCRYVILSNGNIHYLWDLSQGEPYRISAFPTQDSLRSLTQFEPNPKQLVAENIGRDYIARTQLPGYQDHASWKSESSRAEFEGKNKLRFLRDYQLKAILALQDAIKSGKSRGLLEMATGTGKTLTAAAIIKLFLRSGNARRVLFLVDRLELEDQAAKAFVQLLKNDYSTLIYKERRDDWRKAEIVVTTVQSLLFNSKYKTAFSPTDFDLVISDEAHRSISGGARAVFEYFIGYKLGLTATPKDYLKRVAVGETDPREVERRQLLDTYTTFGCESGDPTFRYSLVDGVRDGFLINPIVVDARTEITTQLLSEKGYSVVVPAEEDDAAASEDSFGSRDFEKSFFSEPTNRIFCEAFFQNALRDPISGEIGKTIVFAVSQNHAAKITQILNGLANREFPGKYQSDFAVQVTSRIPNAQQYTINFAYNTLLGSANFLDSYRTSKARVCVTVGMMTTGYDCEDLLNLALMRPVFSPSEFVQIKGRGTRKHGFANELSDPTLKEDHRDVQKTAYKLFDFFGNCEFFEDKFDYDEVIKLPQPGSPRKPLLEVESSSIASYENAAPDPLTLLSERNVGAEGMKVDRMLFQKFADTVQDDATLKEFVDNENWEQAADYVKEHVLDKPEEYFTLEKLRKDSGVDRRVTLREILEKAFGRILRFKSKGELMEDEFDKFLLSNPVDDPKSIPALRYFFKTYLSDSRVRQILDEQRLTALNTYPALTVADYKAVPVALRTRVPEYIKDYVPLNKFM